MKTAEVILENEWNKNKNNYPFNEIYIGEKIAINNAMIEFAKYHVEQALEKAYQNSEIIYPEENNFIESIDKESILNSYPLENIK